MIEGGRPVGVAAGEAIGPYGNILRRYVVPFSEVRPAQPATTYLPYFVAGTDVAVLGRNNRSGLQVWSADWGYPGDFDYREFHKKDGVSGMQYWRVSGARVPLGDKDAYHPDWAAGKVGEHAASLAHLVGDLLKDYQSDSQGYGVVCANYDTELFGHWWFEGVSWIEAVLRELAASRGGRADDGAGVPRGPPAGDRPQPAGRIVGRRRDALRLGQHRHALDVAGDPRRRAPHARPGSQVLDPRRLPRSRSSSRPPGSCCSCSRPTGPSWCPPGRRASTPCSASTATSSGSTS